MDFQGRVLVIIPLEITDPWFPVFLPGSEIAWLLLVPIQEDSGRIMGVPASYYGPWTALYFSEQPSISNSRPKQSPSRPSQRNPSCARSGHGESTGRGPSTQHSGDTVLSVSFIERPIDHRHGLIAGSIKPSKPWQSVIELGNTMLGNSLMPGHELEACPFRQL